MSQDVKVYRTLQFYAQGGATRMSTIDTDDSATICYWRPETDDTGALHFGDGTKDMDVKVFLGTSAKYCLFDVGNVLLQLEDVDLLLGDNDELRFGDASGGDVVVKWDATNLTVIPATDNTGVLEVGNDGTKSMDVKFYGATASAYMEWDNSADRLNIVTVSGRTIAGEEHAVDITMGGTVNSSDDSMVGLNVAVTPSGTLGTWASGIFAKVTQTVESIDGYISGAEFEVNKSGSITNRVYGVIVLNNGNNIAGAQSSSAFIMCREYGSNVLNALVKFGDNASYSASASEAVAVSVAADGAATHKVRFITTIAGVATPMWFLATTTAPAA